MPLAVSVCPAVTVWCTSMTTSSETVGRPGEVCYRCSLYLRISALNHAELAEYLGRVVVDDCGDAHARLPQRSSHFGGLIIIRSGPTIAYAKPHGTCFAIDSVDEILGSCSQELIFFRMYFRSE
ncbi:hypothetical protein TNCV_4390201 [Trichonephila clavipes]|nr:hypothetical protein TNCV_4390201 [Trichonephila clavipes]